MKKNIFYLWVILCVVICMCGCSASKETMIQDIKNCAAEYGLENVDVRLADADYHEAFLYCSNFTSLDWNLIFEMDATMSAINGVKGIVYVEGNPVEGQPYYVQQDKNEIDTYNKSDDIVYHGGWDNVSSENRQERIDAHTEAINQEKDRLISTHECGVCGKQATERIDDEYYCDEHYEDALEWYIEQLQKDK